MKDVDDNATATQTLPRLLDKAAAVETLSVSVRTIDRLRAAGEIQSLTVGERTVRIVASSIESLVERQLVIAQPAVEAAPAEAADPFAIPLLVELQAAAAKRRAEKTKAEA